MIKPTGIAKPPREHFKRAVQDELSKFERRERLLRKSKREERAAQLRLPILRRHLATAPNRERD